MKNILLFFGLLFIVMGMACAQSVPTDEQVKQSAIVLGIPYDKLKEFVDSFHNSNNQFIGTVFYSDSGDGFEFRTNSEYVYHFVDGSRQAGKYSIINGVIEAENRFGHITPLKIIDNNTLERHDGRYDIYRKR